MRIGIASDHAGFDLRQTVIAHLAEIGHQVVDFGADTKESTDYPIYGGRVGKAVASGLVDRGVAICGSGVGISISANKVRGVRCVLCSEPYSAVMSRRHNNANVVAFGARIVGPDMACAIVDAFLETSYEGGRHARRVGEITALETGQDLG